MCVYLLLIRFERAPADAVPDDILVACVGPPRVGTGGGVDDYIIEVAGQWGLNTVSTSQ